MPEQYQSGPFTVTESTAADPDGKQWLDLKMILTGQVRVPCATGGADRSAQLKAEKSILRGMIDDITKALETDEDD